VGRKRAITDKIRRRLVARATLHAAHRRMKYEDIARLEGVQAGRKALLTAFRMESYGHRVATAKPLLTEAQKQVRLAWATEHLSWKPEQWARVIWTDECSFSTEGFGRVYVTRRPEEKYEQACCVPKFRSYSSWTIHGSISTFSKGPMVVIGKKWGGPTGKVHREKVLPWVFYFMDWVAQHPENRLRRAILMEDNASPHTAKLTKQLYYTNGIEKMSWPANSPDLNPIENVWRMLKQRVAKRSPRSLAELRQCVEKEWAALEVRDFVKYIKNMNERCQAVVDARGGHIKW
jgi:transposase